MKRPVNIRPGKVRRSDARVFFIHGWLLAALRRHKLSLEVAAARAGLSRACLYRARNEPVSGKTAEAIGRVFGASLKEIVRDARSEDWKARETIRGGLVKIQRDAAAVVKDLRQVPGDKSLIIEDLGQINRLAARSASRIRLS